MEGDSVVIIQLMGLSRGDFVGLWKLTNELRFRDVRV